MTIKYIYSDKNILAETRTEGTKTFKKTYINGIGTDNLIAYDNEEANLSADEKVELNFCNARVLSDTGSFVKYGWSAIVDRCNTLSNSGTVIVTNRYYFQKDHLGSIIGLTDSSGSLVQSYKYDVYGSVYVSSGTGYIAMKDFTGNLHGNTRFFTGREYDKETGLYYLRARYYDPVVGRFMSRDPIGQVDDVNLYGYVGNRPLKFTDPTWRAKAIIIIGQEKSPWEFNAGAMYQYNQYLKHGFKPKNIIIKNANSAGEFNDILHDYNNVASVTLISHGSPKTLGKSRNQPMIGENNISELTPITNENGNMCVNTTVNLIACNAGAGENSIGQQMANQLDVSVIAADSFVFMNSKPKSDSTIWEELWYYWAKVFTWLSSDGEPIVLPKILPPWLGSWNLFHPY